MKQKQSVEEISQLTELPCTLIKEIEEQLNRHSEWNNEQILEINVEENVDGKTSR